MTREPRERRRQHRVCPVGGSALVGARDRERAHFDVESLSVGGARLVGALAVEIGESIAILLEVAGHSIPLDARVVRVIRDGARYSISVAFVEVSGPTEQVLQAAVASAIEARRVSSPPLVLVVSARSEIRAALEQDLRALGRTVKSTATSAEAVWHLGDPTLTIETTIIDPDAHPADDFDVLGYVARVQPQTRRVWLSDGAGDLEDTVLTQRVHSFLRTPWHPQTLALALSSRVMSTDA